MLVLLTLLWYTCLRKTNKGVDMFYGREPDVESLNALWRKKTASLVTCRGRRRIGKSTLIEEFAKRSEARFLKLEGIAPDKPLGVPWTQTPKPGIWMLSSAHPQPLPQPFSEARAWPGWDWSASLSRTRCPSAPAPPRAGPAPACLRPRSTQSPAPPAGPH